MFKIVFEGMDGCGKGTQVDLFSKWLDKNGILFRQYHEPGILRSKIMRACKEEMTDKAERIALMFLEDGILCRKRELAENYPVIIRDRDTTISMYTYHNGIDCSMNMIRAISTAINAINSMDVVFYIRVPVWASLERIKKRNLENGTEICDFFEKEEKLIKVHQNYETFFDVDSYDLYSSLRMSDFNKIIIDGTQPIEVVHNEIITKFKDVFIGRSFDFQSEYIYPLMKGLQ